jgi:hypothetical protein
MLPTRLQASSLPASAHDWMVEGCDYPKPARKQSRPCVFVVCRGMSSTCGYKWGNVRRTHAMAACRSSAAYPPACVRMSSHAANAPAVCNRLHWLAKRGCSQAPVHGVLGVREGQWNSPNMCRPRLAGLMATCVACYKGTAWGLHAQSDFMPSLGMWLCCCECGCLPGEYMQDTAGWCEWLHASAASGVSFRQPCRRW